MCLTTSNTAGPSLLQGKRFAFATTIMVPMGQGRRFDFPGPLSLGSQLINVYPQFF
jgi:hypothetical protein